MSSSRAKELKGMTLNFIRSIFAVGKECVNWQVWKFAAHIADIFQLKTFLYFEHFKNSDTQLKTSGFFYLEKSIKVTEDFNLQQHCCENIKLLLRHGPLFCHVCLIIHSRVLQNVYNCVFSWQEALVLSHLFNNLTRSLYLYAVYPDMLC